MYRELGLLLILLLGATLIYLLRSDDSQISSRSKKKKNKKKNKKATKVTATSEDINASVDDNLTNSTSSPATNAVPSFIMRRYQRQGTESSTSPATSDSLTKQPSTIDDTTIAPCKHQKEDTRNRHYSTNSQKHTPSRPSKKVDFPPLIAPTPKDTSSKKINEADKNMVSPTNYSRVLRIRTESSSPSKMSLGKAQMQHPDEPLTKKQRENQVRATKRKELKAQADALQEERLRQHQRQLAGHSIGTRPKKKHTGATPSRRPTGKASLNEFGQLVWD